VGEKNEEIERNKMREREIVLEETMVEFQSNKQVELCLRTIRN
jgi:hypothetical protein